MERPEELPLNEHMRRQALVVRDGSQPLRLVERRPSLGQAAAFDQRGAQLDEQRDPPRIVGGEQPGNPLEQADRRGQVAADERPPSCRLEPVGRSGGEKGGARVERSDRGTVLEGLFQVVADDLLEFAEPVPGRSLEPGGVALVQIGPRVLRQRAIGGVADQAMAEAESLLAGEVGGVRADQIPADESLQAVLERRVERRAEFADGAAVKHQALDRRGRQDRTFVGRKAFKTGGEERVDRRGNGQLGKVRRGHPVVALAREQRVVDEHRHKLLYEERVALGRTGDP